MNQLASYMQANKIGKMPSLELTPTNIAGLASAAAIGGYGTYSLSGNISLSILGGLSAAFSLWVADRYFRFSGPDANDGYHPLTDPPDDIQHVVRKGKMDYELTDIYRAVFKDESITVERGQDHPRFVVHVIWHDDTHLLDKRKLRTLARRLNVETEKGREPPFQIIHSMGNGASGIVMPKVIPEGEKPEPIPFERNLIKRGVLTSFIGRDIQGRPMRIDRIKTPHAMFVGGTNSGKTVGLRNQIFSDYLARPDSVFYGIDYKSGIKNTPMTRFESDLDKSLSVLAEVVKLAKENAKIVIDSGYEDAQEYEEQTGIAIRPVHLVIDEYNEFKAVVDRIILDRWSEEKVAAKEAGEPAPIKPELVNDIIGRLSRVHRAHNVYITISGQQFLAADYPTGFTNMFDARACFRVVNGAASRQAIGENGAEDLPEMGGLILRAGSGNIQVGAAAFMTPEVRRDLLRT